MAVAENVTTTDLVAHLYRRAGFGALPSELSSASAAGYDATVDALVAGLAAPDAGADAIATPTFSTPVRGADRAGVVARRAQSHQLHEQFAELTTWWLSRMLATTNPLKEKLAFLLHGHFPTAISKVRYPLYMYTQNQLFRTQGSGDFTELTQAVAQDPAMLIWLDANSNKASNPNENFARELMERFTMGVGTYTQADVRAASYCFTGWRLDRKTGGFSISARRAQHDTTGLPRGERSHDRSAGDQPRDRQPRLQQVRAVALLELPRLSGDTERSCGGRPGTGVRDGSKHRETARSDLRAPGLHPAPSAHRTREAANRVRGWCVPRAGHHPDCTAADATSEVGLRLRRPGAGALRSPERGGLAPERLLALDRGRTRTLEVRARAVADSSTFRPWPTRHQAIGSMLPPSCCRCGTGARRQRRRCGQRHKTRRLWSPWPWCRPST